MFLQLNWTGRSFTEPRRIQDDWANVLILVNQFSIQTKGDYGISRLPARCIEASCFEVDIESLPVKHRSRGTYSRPYGNGVVELTIRIFAQTTVGLVDVSFISVLNVDAAIRRASDIPKLVREEAEKIGQHVCDNIQIVDGPTARTFVRRCVNQFAVGGIPHAGTAERDQA